MFFRPLLEEEEPCQLSVFGKFKSVGNTGNILLPLEFKEFVDLDRSQYFVFLQTCDLNLYIN